MAKYPCLEDNTIILALDKECFKSLTEEPGFDEVEETTRESHPDADDEEIKRRYKIFVRMHGQDLRTLNMLHQYGNSREEMISSIKVHLNECEKCRQFYLKFLDEQAEMMLRWAKTRGLNDNRTKAYAESTIEQGYQRIAQDWDILGYLNSKKSYNPRKQNS